MTDFSIGEVAERVGVQASALRYYESEGLLPKPRRVNGRRLYDDSIFPKISLIQMARQVGFTIAEIKTLKHGFEPDTPLSARWRTLAQDKLGELERRIAKTQQMVKMLQNGLTCGCLQIEDCIYICANTTE